MKHEFKEKGFTVVEGVVVAVVLIALAAGGWYVWQKAKQADNTKTAEQKQEQSSNAPTGGKDQSSTKEKQYNDAQYSFTYPANWSADPSEKESVVLESDDYEEARLVEAQQPYYVTSQGNQLAISEISSTAPNETLEKLTSHIENEETGLGGGSHKQITVDGYQALWVNNKHESTYLYAIVFHDGTRTHIQLNAKDDTDPNTISLFDDILASFKFK